jgi:2-haloacid dehalogenase
MPIPSEPGTLPPETARSPFRPPCSNFLSPAGFGPARGDLAIMPRTTAPRIAVFDIGGVLIDWNPRHLYRKLFENEAAMEDFLSTVCTPAWNLEQDRGRSWEEAVDLLVRRFPERAELIAAYHLRWEEMVPGPIPGTAGILKRLKARGPVYAITNFSAEKLRLAQRRFDVLNRFDGMVVSGSVGLLKPDPAIYRCLLDGYGLDPAETLFIDDAEANILGARAVGMHAHHFTGSDSLLRHLRSSGLL